MGIGCAMKPGAPSTSDAFFGGRLRLRQAAGGHRVGTDAALLAAATPRGTRGMILDMGAGVGAVGLAAAILAPAATVGLIEIDPAAAALALENIDANGLADRVRLFAADALSPAALRAAGLENETAALLLTNPPFYTAGAVRASPDAAKARAHVAEESLEAWMKAAAALLAPGGVFVMIHRAEALADCLAGARRRLGGLRVLPVAPRAEAPATRILLRGVKGSRAPLALLPPLVLHEADGGFCALAGRLHRGEGDPFDLD
jgi:tRNA1(Val) A37 N6-methylase TrmN6